MERRDFIRTAATAGFVAAEAVAGSEASHASRESTVGPADADAPQEKVLGIGGVFFRSSSPDSLGLWYQEHLGIPMSPTTMESPVWNTEAGVTIFSPFPTETKYFGDQKQMWMLNFRVRDLDKMVAQLTKAGITVKVHPGGDAKSGYFARLHDPDGNPIELWQPGQK